jgi:NADH:ubiquinone oxidoreductase subunit F (NADH-binding)
MVSTIFVAHITLNTTDYISLQDPMNFGAILRTSSLLGVSGVIVPQQNRYVVEGKKPSIDFYSIYII